MKKLILIIAILLPLIVKGQWSQNPDSLVNQWIYKDREFRQKNMYCLKGEYSQEMFITYITKRNTVKREKVKQVIKMYILKSEYSDPLLPAEVGITEYWTLNNEQIDFGSVRYVYNEKY